MSIPKTIHYCWFGHNPKPKLAQRCINSWKKYCPDYKIIEWNEDNFDVRRNLFCKQAYEAKKWAFVTDYARLWIIYHYGGIYMDTDVEVVKSLDDFLENTCYLGFENENIVANGLGFGAEKRHPFIKENMEVYDNIWFLNDDGSYNTTPCPTYTTELLINKGLQQSINTIQKIQDVTIYPKEYFCPKDLFTGKIKKTKNSHSIHHFDASWWSVEQRNQYNAAKRKKQMVFLLSIGKKVLRSIIRDKNYNKLKKLANK